MSDPDPTAIVMQMDSMDEDEMVPHHRLSRTPDTEKTTALWRQLMDEGQLKDDDFKNYWRLTVPKLYTPEPNRNCLDMSFDEDRASALLLRPLETFMCGGEPADILQKLSQLDRPPSVCGRVFKLGEPAYSCRECGMDNTCVLCVDCFKRSPHRNHKYKMGTSSGGGCCDCGDPEAWRRDPFCDTHIVGTLPREESEGLPEDLSQRASLTMSAVLNYCYRLLTLDHSTELPCDMKLRHDERDPLQILDQPDTFCTVLYNDETHTFEQVINTLTRVMKCTQRDAIEYVTIIDREGRAIVKCSDFQHCVELQTEIERYTSRHGNRSLKVLVLHSHVLAHQIFTMKLLQWLQKFLAHVEGFRSIFTEVVLRQKPAPDVCIAEAIMLRDCKLWKAARTAWHRLLISGMLMDCSGKKALASVFTKHYSSVMKEFIRDDHDHSFSISSLSVQMYTVPTLAHHLIAKEDALFMLFNTFTSECWKRCNKDGRLEFDRTVSNSPFKRAQFILYDVKYLLSCVPDQWNDCLKKGFLHGTMLLLNLLGMMQGMDAVSRQHTLPDPSNLAHWSYAEDSSCPLCSNTPCTARHILAGCKVALDQGRYTYRHDKVLAVIREVGQHMEFEPEWESAFNLHIKLAIVITMALRWCGGDRIVLAKAYKATIRKISESYVAEQPLVVKELADHSASVIPYDVSTLPVSIHLPLSRFLAGLHLQLDKHQIDFDCEEFRIQNKPTPVQIIEPVLRTAAMIAQVHSGMWRRNGYALLNQLYFYHNVKCRPEMLDRDIVLLQVGASLIESNEFLIHVLNKFGLLTWASSEFESTSLKTPEEDSMRQTICLVEEFLGLMITIIGERYMPGVGTGTAEDRIKKEIIQQLCVRPMSHSELNKTLPENELHETGMEAVIDEVAEFKKPPGQGKGVYTLRPHLYERYDAFFHHYTREELSKSEEEQRRRRKAQGLAECCPPPPLPALAPPFLAVANLAQCDVMLHVLRSVLSRALDLRARSFSETQLHKALHLMGYALHDEESGRYPFLRFSERAAGLLPLLEQLAQSARVEAHRSLLEWTAARLRGAARAVPPPAPDAALPGADPERERRARLAARRRAQVMAQMQTMQKNFMKDNAELFEKNDTDKSTAATDVQLAGEALSEERAPAEEAVRTCILCQEEAPVDLRRPPLVLAAFVQRSSVLLKTRSGDANEADADEPFLAARAGPAAHVSTCGHVMHGRCWRRHFDNVRSKEERRPYRARQPASYDVAKGEFLCPLCERLSNAALPLLPAAGGAEAEGEAPFGEWLRWLRAALERRAEAAAAERAEAAAEAAAEATEAEADPAPAKNTRSRLARRLSGKAAAPHRADCPLEALLRAAPEPKLDAAPVEGPSENGDRIGRYAHEFCRAVAAAEAGTEPGAIGGPANRTLVWRATATTLLATSQQLPLEGRSALGEPSARHRECLQALCRLALALGAPGLEGDDPGAVAARLAEAALRGSPLRWDSVGLLVPLAAALPALDAPGRPAGRPGARALRLAFLAHVVKVLVVSDYSHLVADDAMEGASAAEPAEGCARVLEAYETAKRGRASAANLSARLVWNAVREASRDFLRCACLLFRFAMDAPPPRPAAQAGDAHEAMCAYLGLPPTFDALLASEAEMDLLRAWSGGPEAERFFSGETDAATLEEPRRPPSLVALPQDYSELINTVSLFTCPNSELEDSRNPTMCLICGEMLCSQSYCCQTEVNKALVGACMAHAAKCGGGAGVFLRVRECETLLIATPARGCVLTAPYLDEYGEADPGLRRGNPLRLCVERYETLRLLWLSHGVHEKIARSADATGNVMSTTWQHL